MQSCVYSLTLANNSFKERINMPSPSSEGISLHSSKNCSISSSVYPSTYYYYCYESAPTLEESWVTSFLVLVVREMGPPLLEEGGSGAILFICLGVIAVFWLAND